MQIFILGFSLMLCISSSRLNAMCDDSQNPKPCAVTEIVEQGSFKDLINREKVFLITDLEGLQRVQDKDQFTDFDFSKYRIHQIPENIFLGFERLTFLDLSSNQLMLSSKMFVGLSNLKKLLLDSNGITDVPIEVLKGLKNIKELSLSHNAIVVFPNSAFECYEARNIEVLHLNHNEIQKFDYDTLVWALTSLKILDMSNNKLKEVNGKKLIDHPCLKFLDIRHNITQEKDVQGNETSMVLKYTGPDFRSLTIVDKDPH